MINHIALGALDPVGLAGFYEGVLGLVRRHEARDERGVRAVWLDLGASGVLMIERSSRSQTAGVSSAREADDVPAGPPPPGGFFFALNIKRESLAEHEARLAGAGVIILQRSDYTIYFRDPEGNRVGLSWFDPAEYLSD